MKWLVILSAASLAGCVGTGHVSPPVTDLVLAYGDLALETAAGRRVLAVRVEHSAASFCAAYDPHNPEAIFDARLAIPRLCPGAARIMLVQRMPAHVRRAWRAGTRDE